MTTAIHVDDAGTTIYIAVRYAAGDLVPVAEFPTRTVEIRAPQSHTWTTVAPADTAVDPEDTVTKLRLVTGAGNDFAVTEPGPWIAYVTLGDAEVGHQWTTPQPVTLCYAYASIP